MQARTLRFLRGLALLSAPGVGACQSVEAVDRADSDVRVDARSYEAAATDAPSDSASSSDALSDSTTSSDTTAADSGVAEVTPCDSAGTDVGGEYRFGTDAAIDALGGSYCDLVNGVLGTAIACPAGWTCTWTGCVERWPCEKIACGSIYCAGDLKFGGGSPCQSSGGCLYGAPGGAFPPPDLPSV